MLQSRARSLVILSPARLILVRRTGYRGKVLLRSARSDPHRVGQPGGATFRSR